MNINLYVIDFGPEPRQLPNSNPFPIVGENEKKDISLTHFNDALLREDFDKIIEDPEFFWLAFCKAFSQIQNKSTRENGIPFSASLSEDTLILSGDKWAISAIQGCIEEIRKFFIKGKSRGNFSILPILIAHDYYLSEKVDTIDLTNHLDPTKIKLYKFMFEEVIEPAMPNLCASLGAICTNDIFSQKVLIHLDSGITSREIKALKIEWTDRNRHVYPIPPKVIPERGDPSEFFYSMYKSQTLCDFSLIASDGVVMIHSLLLLAHGGAIKGMLHMKESAERAFRLTKYSMKAVEALIYFLYLGKLEPEYCQEKEINICELLDLADMYQIIPLIDCCTNVLSLFSSLEDLEKITELADRYNNPHLKTLKDYLFKKRYPDQKNLIKV